MTIPATSAVPPSSSRERAGAGVIVVAVLVVLACLGFAAVNVLLETTSLLAGADYSEFAAEYSITLTVMNWVVFGMKLFGAALAMLSVVGPTRFVRPLMLGVLLWAAFATLAVYVSGSLVQAAGMLTGLAGSPDQVDIAGVAYVLFFLLFASGFGVLAISYSRRHTLPARVAVLGTLGAPLVLGSLFVAAPAALAALGPAPGP